MGQHRGIDQTDEAQALVTTLVRMVEEKRLKVKVYTKGRLRAKAYIFDYGNAFDASGKAVELHEKGIAFVGSSNLTLSGVTHNTELNVCTQGNSWIRLITQTSNPVNSPHSN